MGAIFNKEHAIEEWIQETASKKSLTPQDERELRSHFIESIDHLNEKGLSDEEAFAVARIRTGSPDVVASEFGRVNGLNMLNHEWVFLFYGAGFAVILYQITQLFNLFIADLSRKEILSIGQSAWLISSFYLLLFTVVAFMFKNGEVVSRFLKRYFFQPTATINLLFAVVVALFMILPINYFLGYGKTKEQLQQLIEISYYGIFHELIMRGAFPILLFITIFLASPYVRNKFNIKEIIKGNSYFYILLLSLVTAVIAAMCSRMLVPEGIIGYITYGIILLTALLSFSFCNKTDASLLLKQIAFISIPLSIEIYGVIIRSDGNIATSPLLGFGVAVLSSSFLGIIISKIKLSRK